MEAVRSAWLFEIASAFQRCAAVSPPHSVDTVLEEIRIAVPLPYSPVERLIFEGFVSMARNAIKIVHGDTRSRSGSLEERAVQLLHDRYGEHLTYKVIGRQLGCDPEYLEVLFRRKTGQSLHTYLRRHRVSKALVAIQRGEKIEAAALQCGFRSKSGFIRACRAVTGNAPSHWRAPEEH